MECIVLNYEEFLCSDDWPDFEYKSFIDTRKWWESVCEYLVSSEDKDNLRFFYFLTNDSEVIGVVPLIHKRGYRNGLPCSYWTTIWHSHATLQNAIVHPQHMSSVTSFLKSKLDELRNKYPWDFLYINSYLASSNDFWHFFSQVQPPKYTKVTSTTTSMYFDVRGSYEDAVSNAVKNNEKNLRRQARVLSDIGPVDFGMVREMGDKVGALDMFFGLEHSGWKGGECTSILCHENLVNFYTNFIIDNPDASIVWLTVGDEPAAAAIVLYAGRQLNFIKIAYNEEFNKGSPSNQLLSEMLHQACSAYDIDKLSLTTGPKWAKDRWRPNEIPVDSFTLFNYNSVYGKLHYFVEMYVKSLVKKLIKH